MSALTCERNLCLAVFFNGRVSTSESRCKHAVVEAPCFLVHWNRGNKPINHYEREYGAEIGGSAGTSNTTPGTRNHASSSGLSCTREHMQLKRAIAP